VSRSRIIVAVSAFLWVAHIVVCTSLGSSPPGPVLSDILQLVIGGLLITAMLMAAKRSEGMARAFWRLATGAYTLWMIAQSLGVYNDLARTPVPPDTCRSLGYHKAVKAPAGGRSPRSSHQVTP